MGLVVMAGCFGDCDCVVGGFEYGVREVVLGFGLLRKDMGK